MYKPFATNHEAILNHINPSEPVRVYRNLHKQCYSIQQNGIVRCHADHVELYDCTFKVFERGRQRVLREQRKNVHSFIIGKVSACYNSSPYHTVLFYDPYKSGDWLRHSFLYPKPAAVSSAFLVRLDHRGCTAACVELKGESE